MNTADIIEMMKQMKRNGIRLLELDCEGSRLKMECADLPDRLAAVAAESSEPGQYQSVATGQTSEPDEAVETDENAELVSAPVVGVFYAAASPDSDPYVKPGAAVEAGATVCIIEAMKLMNEVTCHSSGKVQEIYVTDGQRVEYGQPLMRIVQE
jgi:acetyl-CoA carboxylase biotin carboxyl carrier protein